MAVLSRKRRSLARPAARVRNTHAALAFQPSNQQQQQQIRTMLRPTGLTPMPKRIARQAGISLVANLYMAQRSGGMNVPAMSQYAMGLGYWKHVFSNFLQQAISTATPHVHISLYVHQFRQQANTLIRQLQTAVHSNLRMPNTTLGEYDVWVTDTRRGSYYISTREYRKRLRRIYPRLRAVTNALVTAAQHEGVGSAQVAQLKKDIRFHWRRLADYWKASGQYACSKAATRVVNLRRGRGVKLVYRPLHLWKTPQRINDTVVWYKEAYTRLCPGTHVPTPWSPSTWRPGPLYKRRRHTHHVQYNSNTLKRGARAIIGSLDAGVPVHARVLSGYIHKAKLKAVHSIVLHKYLVTGGDKRNPTKVDFIAVDVDGGHRIRVELDSGVSGGRFEFKPAQVCWFQSGSTWEYDNRKKDAPWRYQVLAIFPTSKAWRDAGKRP
jgi:hypothetical protein